LACFALITGGVTLASAAVTWNDFQFGGFASQGYLKSSANDYLGDTSSGTFDFREYAANASWSKGKFRIGAQAFGQKLGAYGDDKIKLDWATIDYQATQWFGLRAGRVKMPRGLYNEALDLDSVRPFVLLPQSIYDNRLRDFNASFDGGMIYGNVSLKSAGSLDYRVFYGNIPIARDSGAADYFNNDIVGTVMKIQMDSVHGGSLFWNTPASGLRLGYSYSNFKNMTSSRKAFVPSGPPPAPMMERTFNKSTPSYDRHLVSIEYSTGDWLFAAEAGREKAFYGVHDVGFGIRVVSVDYKSDSFYLSAARRINRWLEIGTYYSHSRDTQTIGNNVTGQNLILPDLIQGDFALSTKFDINEHVIFKLEGHYMDGSGKIYSTIDRPQPFASRDNSWLMLAAKVTFSF
jgi:hypothetical protein